MSGSIRPKTVNGFLHTTLFLLLALVLCYPVNAQSESARVAFLRGMVVAIAEDGTERRLKRDDRVQVGEIIESGPKGLAQIVFPDTSVLHIKANSRIGIEAYRFDPNNPDNDEMVTNVIKGGLRALTGAIGKRDPDKVKFKNKVATIGIRGTAIEVGAESVIFDYGNGYIENQGGVTELESGESAKAASDKVKAKKVLSLRPSDDPSVIAGVLVGAPLKNVPPAVEVICKVIEQDDAILLVGMENHVPGYRTEVVAATIEGLTVCFVPEDFATVLTASVLILPDETPQMLSATLRGAGNIDVKIALKAALRGLERPTQDLVNQVVTAAVLEGNLDYDSAKEVLQDVQEEGFCR